MPNSVVVRKLWNDQGGLLGRSATRPRDRNYLRKDDRFLQRGQGGLRAPCKRRGGPRVTSQVAVELDLIAEVGAITCLFRQPLRSSLRSDVGDAAGHAGLLAQVPNATSHTTREM